MQPLLPPPDVQAALSEFESWGAVVEHFLFVAPSNIDLLTHQAAAKAGLEAALGATHEGAPLRQEVQVDWAKFAPERAHSLRPAQFFGKRFHFELRKPLFFFPNSVYLHPFDDEKGASARQHEIIRAEYIKHCFDNETEGYASAILDPPYGLYHSPGWFGKKRPLLPLEIGFAFLRLCDALFGPLNSLEIYSWPTDCSPLFKPGYEWWGSSFWTVYAPAKKWIVTIIASSTD